MTVNLPGVCCRSDKSDRMADMQASLIRKFLRGDGGATAIEYSLVVGLIFLAIVGAVQGLGNSVVTVLYTKIQTIL
jgi:Flp pilus assembly pilin Flp